MHGSDPLIGEYIFRAYEYFKRHLKEFPSYKHTAAKFVAGICLREKRKLPQGTLIAASPRISQLFAYTFLVRPRSALGKTHEARQCCIRPKEWEKS